MKSSLLLVALSAVVVGCSSVSSAPTEKSADASSKGGKLKVVYIAKNTGNPYFTQVENGFKKASEKMGFEFTAQAPATAEATSQLQVIKDQVQRGVDVIAISPNSPDALNEALDEARAKGIVVICVDADLVGNEGHRDAAVMPTDPAKVGLSQLELLGKLTNYTGDFAILSATTDAPNQNTWIAGMKEALKDPKFSKMKLVATVYGDDESQKSSTEAESLLTKFPGLKGIVSPTSVGLAAAAQVIENAGVYPGGAHAANGGVQLTGLSTPNQMRKAVEKGVVTSFQLWAVEDTGYVAGCLGALVKSKKAELKTGSSIDIPGKDKVTVGDKAVIYTGPMVTFDKSNIAKFNF